MIDNVRAVDTRSDDFMLGVDMVRRYQRIKEQMRAPVEHPLATRLRTVLAKRNARWVRKLDAVPLVWNNSFSGSSNYAHATLFGAQPGTVYTGTALTASVLQGTR